MAINAERLYENAKEALRLACIDVHEGNVADGEGLYEIMTKDPDTYLAANTVYFRKAQPALEIYVMAKDELGKARGGTAYSAVKRFVKGCADHRPNLKGVWYDAAGRQCMCDGYHAIRLNKPVDGIETVSGMDLDKVFPTDAYFTDPVELHIPTPGELKINAKKAVKYPYQKLYDFGDGLPLVSVRYLKDIMDCLPGATAVCERSKALSGIIYFHSDKGDAILLPVRKRDVA